MFSVQNMEEVVRQADIVIAAAGQAALIKGSWIKPGAAVIDVGTNAVTDATKKAGFRCVDGVWGEREGRGGLWQEADLRQGQQ